MLLKKGSYHRAVDVTAFRFDALGRMSFLVRAKSFPGVGLLISWCQLKREPHRQPNICVISSEDRKCCSTNQQIHSGSVGVTPVSMRIVQTKCVWVLVFVLLSIEVFDSKSRRQVIFHCGCQFSVLLPKLVLSECLGLKWLLTVNTFAPQIHSIWC